MIREAVDGDLGALLELYLHLHETGIPEDGARLRAAWAKIMADPDHHIIVCERGGRIVASLAKMLHEKKQETGKPVRGLISICAAGGQGVTAILEA